MTIILLFASEGKKTLCRDLVRSCQVSSAGRIRPVVLRSPERGKIATVIRFPFTSDRSGPEITAISLYVIHIRTSQKEMRFI